ncbi:MAG: BNR-4 repeat-containing protein [Thermoguttaceae bacterium]
MQHLAIILLASSVAAAADPLPEDDGYRGIWYANQPSGDQFKFKYSGGLATYPQQHIPIACYAPEARKTFFVYGGTPRGANRLVHMVSYYDHATGSVPRPRILLDKKTDDAHDNPTLMLDPRGYLWIFSNAHGTSRPAYIHRSERPYRIEAFERIAATNFSYCQPWFLPGEGFCLLHTRYTGGRRFLFVWRSRDGLAWEEPQPLARVAQGHYQISWRHGERIGTALNYHPADGGLNARTNLYYLETRDGGRTWTSAAGQPVQLPLAEVRNPALVRDYESEKRLVYLKDLNFDAAGRPVILYLTSAHYASGPKGDPRIWHTARWNGRSWEIRDVTRSDHNYDFGSLYIEPDGLWRIIAPTEPGPQPYNSGGEVAVWVSRDQGASWQKARQLTTQSRYNHTYVRRPVNAHPQFYALWADGDARQPSESRLYFTNREADHVWRLPERMEGPTARPQIAW